MRNIKAKLHSLKTHKDEVNVVRWSPHNESLLASGSSDRKINIWDISKIGASTDADAQDEFDDGPPELLVTKLSLTISLFMADIPAKSLTFHGILKTLYP